MTAGMLAVLLWAALTLAGILGHLVGDYLVQTSWMARDKAKDLWTFGEVHIDFTAGRMEARPVNALTAIASHALTWAFSVALFLVPATWTAWGPAGAAAAVWACGALGLIHWIQDRRWPVLWFMRATGKDMFDWLVIVVDNVWHILQVAVAAAWIVWRMM